MMTPGWPLTINANFKFGPLCFYMGKRLNDGFQRNYCSLLKLVCIVKSMRSMSFFDHDPRSLRFRCRQHVQTSSFVSEITGPNKAKFHVDRPWDGGTKAYSNHPGHMTKMVPMSVSVKKTFKIFFFEPNAWPGSLKLRIQHRTLEYYQVCSNYYPNGQEQHYLAQYG